LSSSTPEEGTVECSRSSAVYEFVGCLCVFQFRTRELVAFHVHMSRLYCNARLRTSYRTFTGRFHSLYYAVSTGRCLSTFRSILRSLSARSVPELQNLRDLYQLARSAFLKLWSADRKCSSGSALVVLLD